MSAEKWDDRGFPVRTIRRKSPEENVVEKWKARCGVHVKLIRKPAGIAVLTVVAEGLRVPFVADRTSAAR